MTQLEVCATTGLLQRSIDNEIRSAAQVMRLQNIVNKLSEELARHRNTDVTGMQQTISAQAEQIRILGSERSDVLKQFGDVKQREKTLATANAELNAQVESLTGQLSLANQKVEQLTPAVKSKVKKAPAKP